MDSAVSHGIGSMVPYRGQHVGGDVMMLDVPTWLAPSIPAPLVPYGHGPMVPYHADDAMGSDYDIRPDDPNPRPLKFVEGESGTRWGVGPSVSWHGKTPTQMDYILGRLN